MMSEFTRFLEAHFYFNLFSLPFFITAFLFGFVGVYTLKHSARSRLHQTFFSICFALLFWLFSTAVLLSSHDEWWIERSIDALYLAVCFIPISIFHYASMWLGFSGKQKWLVRTGYGVGTLFVPLIWFTDLIVIGHLQHSWGNYSLLSPFGGAIYLSYFGFYMLAFFFNVFRAYRTAQSEILKKQTRIVMFGFLIGYLGSVDFLPCYRISVFPIGAFTTLVLVFSLSYSIIRYKLLDIETVVHKTLMWLATSAIFILPIAMVAHVSKDFLATLPSFWFSVLVFAVCSLIIPYVRAVQPLIDQWFERRRWNLNEAYQKFSGELVHLKSLDELANHILSTLRKTLYPEDLSIFLWDEEMDESLVFSLSGGVKVSSSQYRPFFEKLGDYDTVILDEYIDMDLNLEPVRDLVHDYFKSIAVKVCIPINLDGKMIGLINLSRKANLKNYTSAEVRFLSEIRGSAAIAISNSLRLIAMQAQLRKWNEELDRQVQERTRELKDAQAQLIQAEKLATIGTLAGGVAHEINNPLAAILTNAQMLLAENVSGDAKESLELIEEAADRCRVIVQKLMKYSRKSKDEPDVESVDLKEVIEGVLAFLKYQLEQENVGVSLDFETNARVRGIANEYSQVFTNLIVNAKDALQAKSGKRMVEIRAHEKSSHVIMEVEDNGSGIKPEILPKIFDPFFTTKDVGKGTGLGLSIVQGIVQKFGGQVDVKSTLGNGTTIVLTFLKS